MFIMHEVKGGTRGRETWMFIMHEVMGGNTPFFPKFVFFFFCNCHNFSPLSSVQIIIIPACCLLCVL